MIVVLDTNALASTVRTAGAPLAHLTAYTRQCKSAVYLPEVVKKELRAYLDRYARETEEKLLAIGKRLPDSAVVSRHLAALKKEAHSAKRKMIGLLRDLERRRRLVQLKISAAHARRAVDRATSRRPPCSSKGEEVRDALIWEAALDMVKKRQGPLVFITGDAGFQSDELSNEVQKLGTDLLLFGTIDAFLRSVLIEESSLPPDVSRGLCNLQELTAWMAVHAAEDPEGAWDAAIGNFVEGGVLDRIAGKYRLVQLSEVTVTGGLRRLLDRHTCFAHLAFETDVWVQCDSFAWERRPPGEHQPDLTGVEGAEVLRKLYEVIPVHVPVGEPQPIDIDFHVHGEAVYTVTDAVFAPRPLVLYAEPVAAGFHGGGMTSRAVSFNDE